MHIVLTMTARMIAIVSVCAFLLCIVVFMAGMQVGARLDAHAGTAGGPPARGLPAKGLPAATDATPPPAWPAAVASGAASSNASGE